MHTQLSELKYTIASKTYEGIKPIRNQAKVTIDDWGQEPSVPGRFIYTVSKKRSDERAFGFADAHNKDVATYRYDDYGGVVSIKRRHQHLFKQRESRVLGQSPTAVSFQV